MFKLMLIFIVQNQYTEDFNGQLFQFLIIQLINTGMTPLVTKFLYVEMIIIFDS